MSTTTAIVQQSLALGPVHEVPKHTKPASMEKSVIQGGAKMTQQTNLEADAVIDISDDSDQEIGEPHKVHREHER
ncbi:hypothetical protein FRC08_003112 [Ceratobasidium sp. 394]|nr:hypothetical protein FRC08_003112 [Ceratobasidium sp. 394]